MQCYASPVEPPPFEAAFVDGRYSMERDNELRENYIDAVTTWAKEHGWSGKLTGQTVQFPIADGYAVYLVVEGNNKMALIHLPLGDAWQIPDAHMRGLRKKDIVDQLDRARAIRELFGKKQ
jgi:hypothetical protein